VKSDKSSRKRTVIGAVVASIAISAASSCGKSDVGDEGATAMLKRSLITKSFSLVNPHDANWTVALAGSAHNHTIKLDCSWYQDCTRKEEVLNEFSSRGYDFAAITDHDKSNSDGWDQSKCPSGMVCLWGTEASQVPHHLFFGWSQVSIDEILENDQSYRSAKDSRPENHQYDIEHNISVIAHPGGGIGANRDLGSLYPMPAVGRDLYFDGIEINSDDQFDYWGWALRERIKADGPIRGRPFWGFASDDYHPIGSIADMSPKGWLLIHSDKANSWDAVYQNIKAGNFFAVRRYENTNGIPGLQKPLIDVTTSGNSIRVASEVPSTISFVDVDGAIRRQTSGTLVDEYCAEGDESLIRVVIDQWYQGSRLRIYSQPIAIQFLDGGVFQDMTWMVPVLLNN
jgi:hypothetical protein